MELPANDAPIEVLLYEQSIFTDDATIKSSEAPDVSLPLPDVKFTEVL